MRIAHITDIHLRHHTPGHAPIAVRRVRRARELLMRALADAKSRGADLAVITGDVVDVPEYLFAREREQDDAQLWQAVGADYRLVRQLLDDSGLPWIALPGNHDAYRVMAQELGQDPLVRDHGPLRFVSFWDREASGNVPRRVGRDRVRFEAALADPEPRPQVHLQHFVITPELNAEYPHTYFEGKELARRIVESGRVGLVLSGHYHPGVEPHRQGGATFSVTPALVEHPHTYRLFDVAVQEDSIESVHSEQIELAGEQSAAKAVFLDRDGCINTRAAYREGPGAMDLIPGAANAIRRLRDAGFTVVVVTNQTAVGEGYVLPETVDEVNDRMSQLLLAEGTEVDAIYATFEAGPSAIHPMYATTAERKPSPAMIHRAAADLNLDLSTSYLVGDRISDIEAGQDAGVRPILVRTGMGDQAKFTLTGDSPWPITDNLAAAAELICQGSLPANPDAGSRTR